ncbi:hypothetical protein NL108_018510 [Boleophthalmus pectinirostris]|nr:hypothetical protein NL108_018510 [Boleophthalmus pectinirostris]
MPTKKTKIHSKPDEEKGEVGTQQDGAHDAATGVQNSWNELADLIRTIIREEIRVVVSQLNTIKDDISSCTQKLLEVDNVLSTMDKRITKLEKACEELHKANLELKGKAQRLEMHSRKYNVRVFGLAEDIEKDNPTHYMSRLFKELFEEKLQSEPEVEIAHRIGAAGRATERPMIVRLQKRTTREEILKIATKEGLLRVRGMKLRIFPDLTTEMAKKRTSFREIRSKLRDAGVRHGILHPATLIITFKGETKKFTERSVAHTYVKTVMEPGSKNIG